MKTNKHIHKFNREIYMEDVERITADVFKSLNDNNIQFDSIVDDNNFHDRLRVFLEESFDFPDYRNHN